MASVLRAGPAHPGPRGRAERIQAPPHTGPAEQEASSSSPSHSCCWRGPTPAEWPFLFGTPSRDGLTSPREPSLITSFQEAGGRLLHSLPLASPRKHLPLSLSRPSPRQLQPRRGETCRYTGRILVPVSRTDCDLPHGPRGAWAPRCKVDTKSASGVAAPWTCPLSPDCEPCTVPGTRGPPVSKIGQVPAPALSFGGNR